MRNRYTVRVARVYKANQTEPGAHLLRRLLIESLPKQEKLCYDLAAKDMTAHKLADRLQVKLNHASAILGRLWKYGLLGRVWNGRDYGYTYFHSEKPIYDYKLEESA
jgi:predicted transcriptional regulator of viral defense system